MEKLDVKIINRSNNPNPSYASDGDAGMDIRAYLVDPVVLKPGERRLIPTGIYLGLPKGYECQVRPRSGLAKNYGITVLNSPGTCDFGYIDEIGVILINHGQEDFTIHSGDRIAQLVFAKHETVNFIPVEELDKTNDRGGGFGHTGVE